MAGRIRYLIFIFFIYSIIFAQNNTDIYKKFKLGKKLFNDGLYDQAVLYFKEYMTLQQEDIKQDSAFFLIGLSYLKDNEYTKAKYYLSLFAEKFNDSKLVAEALYYLNKALIKLGEKEIFLDNVKRLQKDFPLSKFAGDATYESFNMLVNIGDIDNAIPLGLSYIMLYPNGEYTSEIAYKISEIYYDNVNYTKVLEYLPEVFKRENGTNLYYRALILKAKTLARLGKYNDALSDFNLILKKNIEDFLVDAFYNKIEIFYENQNYDSLFASSSLFIKKFCDNELSVKVADVLLDFQKYGILKSSYVANCNNDRLLMRIAKAYYFFNLPDSANLILNTVNINSLYKSDLLDYYLLKMKIFDLEKETFFNKALLQCNSFEDSVKVINDFIFSLDNNALKRLYSRIIILPDKYFSPKVLLKLISEFLNINYSLSLKYIDLYEKKFLYLPEYDKVLKYKEIIRNFYDKSNVILPSNMDFSKNSNLLTSYLQKDYRACYNNLSIFEKNEQLAANVIIGAYIKKIIDNIPQEYILNNDFIKFYILKFRLNDTLIENFNINSIQAGKKIYNDFVIELSKYYIEKNKLDDAITNLNILLNSINDKNKLSLIKYYLGKAYFLKGNYQLSKEFLNSFLKTDENFYLYANAEYLLLNIKFLVDQIDENDIANFLAKFPYYNIDEQLLFSVNIYDRIDIFNIVKNKEIKDFLLGKYYFNKKDYRNAIYYFERIKDNSEYFIKSLYLLAQSYRMINKEDKAIDLLKNYVKYPQYKDWERAFYELIDLYIDKNLEIIAKKQMSLVDTLYIKDKAKFDYYNLKLDLLTSYNKNIKKHIEKFRKKYEQKINYYYDLLIDYSEYLIRKKRLSKAEDILKDIIDESDIKEIKYKSLKNLAVVYINNKKFDDAEKILLSLADSLSLKDSLIADVYFSLSTLYYYRIPKELNKAIEYYERILKLEQVNNSLLENTLFNLGMLYEENGQFNDAINVYNRYLDEFPASDRKDRVKFRIGYCFMNTYRYIEAISLYRSLLPFVSGEDAAELHYYLGECYYKNGLVDDALKEFLTVVYDYNEYFMFAVTSYYMIGEIYQKQGQIEKAKRIYRNIIKKYGANSDYGKTAAGRLEYLNKKKD